MHRLTSIGLFLLILVSTASADNGRFPVSEVQQTCAESADISDMIAEHRLYFTMPSTDDKPLMELWFVDRSGTQYTGLSFENNHLLEINPAGSHIFIARHEGDYAFFEKGGFAFGGSSISEYMLVDTHNLSVQTLSLPQEMYDITFIWVMQWLDDERVLLLSTEADKRIAIVNVVTQEVDILEWPVDDVYLPWPSGFMLFSPDGEYLLYTVATPSITRADEHPDRFLAWQIADLNGELVLPYVDGIGVTARWVPDGSSFVVFNRDSEVLSISLEGEVTPLIAIYPDYGLDRALLDNIGNRIAFTGFGFTDNTNMQALVVFDTENQTLIDYCQYALEIMKGMWSPDDRLIPFRAGDPGITEVRVLDVMSNQVSSILPRQPQNDSIGSVFIRIVGWQQMSQ